jgi:hypothetical protein
MSSNKISPQLSNTSPTGIPSRMRVRVGLVITMLGMFIFLLGARPQLFGLDRSPVVGFVQISVFIVGLAFISIGGYISLVSFWRNGSRTIAADVGMRLVATGFVVAVFSGMADIFGFGTQRLPRVPVFGPWQSGGVQFGELLITVGFLLMIPIARHRQSK